LSQYTNKKVDALIEKIRTSQKPEEVQTSYVDFQKLLVADRPAIFLYSPMYRYFVSNDVKGIFVDEIYHPSDRFSGVTKWYIKTDGTFNFKK
jgi:peptide/nickel transport system substrate-binding protein